MVLITHEISKIKVYIACNKRCDSSLRSNYMKIKNNLGFTIIELIIVIVILGILSVTALPKFLNMGQDAHDARAKAIFASFNSAVSMYHGCWQVKGGTGYMQDLSCYGDGDLDSSYTGFPLGITTELVKEGKDLKGSYCKDVWNGLLTGDDFILESHSGSPSFGSNTDIVYWYTEVTLSETAHCYYNYISDNRQKGSENWQLKYFPATGITEVVRATLT